MVTVQEQPVSFLSYQQLILQQQRWWVWTPLSDEHYAKRDSIVSMNTHITRQSFIYRFDSFCFPLIGVEETVRLRRFIGERTA